MVLSILIILLILSLAIVSLSTGNLRTTGNVRARFEALNLATSAINYNMYDFNHMSTSIMTPYPPGPTPTPLSSVPVHGPYNVTIDNPSLDMNQASCKYMYAENLSNPNPSTANFAPYVCDANVPGNTIVIIGEGTYRGYKRVIRAVVRNNPGVAMGMCCDKDANLATIEIDPNGDVNAKLVVNGINDMTSGDPVAASIQANNNLTYNGTDFKFYNGSTIRACATVNATAVPLQNQVSNAAPIDIQEWNISDLVNIADCNSAPVVSVTPAPGTWPFKLQATTEPDPSINTSEPNQVIRPEAASLPSPSISDSERYVAGNKSDPDNTYLQITQNTIVNGNLVVYGNLDIKSGKTLLVNGTLEVNGTLKLSGTKGGNIITAGYRNVDPPSASTPIPSKKGMSLEINKINSYTALASKGNVIFSAGNTKIANPQSNSANEWFYKQPLNVKATKDALKKTAIDNVSLVSDIPKWWNGISPFSPAAKDILTNESEVGSEVSAWFKDADANTYMNNSNSFFTKEKWNAFKVNPTLLFDDNQSFFQGVIYSYGDISVEGPINVIGAVVTVRGTKSPSASTGSIYLKNGGNITANMEYMVGSKPFYRILTDVLSWCEL